MRYRLITTPFHKTFDTEEQLHDYCFQKAMYDYAVIEVPDVAPAPPPPPKSAFTEDDDVEPPPPLPELDTTENLRKRLNAVIDERNDAWTNINTLRDERAAARAQIDEAGADYKKLRAMYKDDCAQHEKRQTKLVQELDGVRSQLLTECTRNGAAIAALERDNSILSSRHVIDCAKMRKMEDELTTLRGTKHASSREALNSEIAELKTGLAGWKIAYNATQTSLEAACLKLEEIRKAAR